MHRFEMEKFVYLPGWRVFNFMQAMEGVSVESRRHGSYTFSCEHLELDDWDDYLTRTASDILLKLTATNPSLPERLVFDSQEVAEKITRLLSLTFLTVATTHGEECDSLKIEATHGVSAQDLGRSLLECRGANV